MASQSKQRPLTAMQRGMSDIISYEDILIAQYMNQIEKSPPTRKQTKDVPVSPYAIATQTGEISKSKRPKSAVALHQKRKDFESSRALASQGRVPLMAWDEGELAPRTTSKKRPTSASSIRSRSSVLSGTGSAYSRSSSKSLNSKASSTAGSSSIKRNKPLYKKKPKVICIRAFQNGNRENFARVTAPDLLQLLDNCTLKLGLVSAARKLFFSDGTLITDSRLIEKDDDVYVSCGEAFKDPYSTLKEKEELRRSACWTLTGIVLPENKSRGKTKTTLSKRMQTLVESQKRRILVFRNGESAEGVEIVAARFNEFLDDCTAKLKLESGARCLFDWEGHEIKSFRDVPVLERILQPSTTTVLGPLWVTRGGESFSPKGAYNFLLTVLSNTKERIRYSKLFNDQLNMQSNCSPDLQSKEVMSMTDEEIQKEIQQVEEHITELLSVVPTLKKQLKRLQEGVDIEGGMETHKYQHISEISPDSRLLGKQGLRFKVFENGRNDGEVIVYFNLAEAEKGIQGDKSQLMHRFLDTCTTSRRVGDGTGGPAGRQIARRVFIKDGKEVTNVHDLEYDQEIWLSYGEDFKPLNVMALQLTLDKASCMSLWDEMEIVQREAVMDEEKGRDRPTAWRAVTGFPPGNKRQLINLDMPGPKRLEYAQGLQKSRVDEKGCFLQYREKKNLVLYPEVTIEVKKKKGAKDIWPPDAQEWAITQGGIIFSKSMPQLSLAKSEHAVQVTVFDKPVGGFSVQLAKRSTNDLNQQWGFSPTGQIYSLAKPSFFLTYVAGHEVTMVTAKDCTSLEQAASESQPQKEEEDLGNGLANLQFLDTNESNGENGNHKDEKSEDANNVSNQEIETILPGLADLETEYGGKTNVIVLLPKLSGKAGLQRWALKQEDLGSIGQWKHTTVANPEWNKKALSWPVTKDGNWNTEYSWPMEGFLLPFAPPVKKPSDKKSALPGSAVRLRVMKNGDSDQTRVAVVVGPDLTNMWHDVSDANRSFKTKRRSLGKPANNSSVGVYESDACHPLDCKRIEIELFLDQCTQALGLPFAGRKLFDEEGREITCISDLTRDQLVYVSCGEKWIDPQMSYSEQQRRALLMNLASDIARIRQYCVLRDPTDLVLDVDGPILPGSRIVVENCVLSSLEREKLIKKLNDDNADEVEDEDAISSAALLSYAITAHERAHQRADERLKSLRWSWENDKTSKGDQDLEGQDEGDFTNEITFSDPVLQKKFVRQAIKTGDAKQVSDPSIRQRWHYRDGFIHLKNNSLLVLGLADGINEGTASNEVVLCKKKLEDPCQRWIISEDGTISLRSNVQFVLTVTTPPLGNDPFSYDKALDHGYLGSAVIVATRKSCENGNCHQLWSFDRFTGFIEAFASDTANKEITAANKSNVCTYAILGQREIYQPGYAYMPGTSREKRLCEACGKASRGKNKLQRLKDSRRFACNTGTNDENGNNGKLSGCFKCLSSKVDLTTLEAESTLELWEYQLDRLRNEGNVRTITKELNVAKSVAAVRILAHRNGEGSRGQGELVIGSSIHSLLDQSTTRLCLMQAARRLYTVRGELITDIHQLFRPYNASMMRSLQESEEIVLAEGDEKKTKKKESPPSIPNGDAVDYIEAENKRYYISDSSKEVQKLDLSGAQDKVDDEDNESGNDTYRLGKGRKRRSLPTVMQDPSGFPRWDTRWPIDVWVSCGEPFIPLEEADKQYLLSMKHREERTWLQAYLDIEKHVLRQMQGRRITRFSPPQSPSNEPTRKEEHKEETINELKMHLLDVKSRQKNEELALSKPAKESTQRLYSTPKTVLDNSTSRLGLSSAARRIFRLDGREILEFADIRRGETFCVSCGDNFIRARDRRHQMELKATWSRMVRCPGGYVLTESTAANVTYEARSSNPQLALPAPPSPATSAFKGQEHPVGQVSVHTLHRSSKPLSRK
ncbi:doublecortin domain-containing protein 1-like isoform X2 [Actinia tenebrosa]|uniref:Doublecortin domain-containing protein 1-like isoform X2 n=1 Tax=Actinia tenebrosa TaxID=6105 RepID=A0A6P8IFK9_ACTTE|nr:doublecortin domain-containing protein 1-like isoform X2 [Actinia tenebrosa]